MFVVAKSILLITWWTLKCEARFDFAIFQTTSIKSLFLLSKSWNNKWKNRKWILMLCWCLIFRTSIFFFFLFNFRKNLRSIELDFWIWQKILKLRKFWIFARKLVKVFLVQFLARKFKFLMLSKMKYSNKIFQFWRQNSNIRVNWIFCQKLDF